MIKPRLLIALPGLHAVARGAETAFEQLGVGLSEEGFDVTLMGTGPARPGQAYGWLQGRMVPRERFRNWPSIPPLRSEYRWEELTFVPSLWQAFDPSRFDLTMTCSYPFVNWVLRAKRKAGRPLHVFVTENGDWPAYAGNREYRWFGCDGLVCTNPVYQQRNQARWRCALIPNGVELDRFTPGPAERAAFGLPDGVPLVCMVSALIPSKFPLEGVRAVAALPGAHLLLAGDGPLREECDRLGQELLGPRYRRVTVPSDRMPAVYRCADVFLHLSRDEAFGNIYIEAAACGLPVVAHDTPSTRWILKHSGRLLDTADADALVRELTTALEKPLDAALVQATREDLRARFSWPVICRQYADFLRALLAHQGSA